MADPTELEIQRLREEVRRLREQNGRACTPATMGGPPCIRTWRRKKSASRRNRQTLRRATVRGVVHRHPLRVLIAAIVLVILLVGGYFWWQYMQSYESTDDARVDGHVNSDHTACFGSCYRYPRSGESAREKGELLVELDPSDYKVALERAQANLQQAAAGVQARRTAVPITSTSTQTGIQTGRSAV